MKRKTYTDKNRKDMKKLHPVMIIGYLIHLCMLMYGGEKAAQKNPLGFTAFFGGAIFLSVIGIIALVCY